MTTDMINVEVVKNNNETSISLIRRFTKRVQGAGIIPRVRGIRYSSRPTTKFSRKKRALKLLTRRATYEKLAKLGKLPPEKRRGGRR